MKMAVAGARPSENNYRLNGIGVNDYANTTPGNALGTNLGVEAVAEFSVLTNSYSAEYGRTSGGVVNAITRSGTNQIRGTVFEFHRNSAMDARDYFDRGEQPPPFHRNQYGVAFGGPLIKNRTFWFGDYEGLREELGQTTVSTTLSEAARQGRLAAGTVTVDPQIARALALYPLPNGPLLGNGDTGQYFAVRNKVSRGDYALGRIDHKLSAKGSFNATVAVRRRRHRTAGCVPGQAGRRPIAAAPRGVGVLAHLRAGGRQRDPGRPVAVACRRAGRSPRC